MAVECTYCGSDVTAHDPVTVSEGLSESTQRRGAFCNYACLESWIDDENLATGAACKWEPAGED